jgi:hypothetical protein
MKSTNIVEADGTALVALGCLPFSKRATRQTFDDLARCGVWTSITHAFREVEEAFVAPVKVLVSLKCVLQQRRS